MSSSLRDRMRTDMKSAMKNKEMNKLQALKLVLAECKNREIELKEDFSEAHIVSILQKQLKQYEESRQQYQQGGRLEAVQEQTERRNLIKSYLPAMLSDAVLKKIIEGIVQESGALSIKDMGRVMKAVQSRAEGPLDKRRLAELVQERLRAV